MATEYGRPLDDQRLEDDVAAGVEVEPTAMAGYLQVRTTFVDQVVTRAIDGGISQIVSVGAGYDGRSLRYAKPGVRWFELDHPDTQADKRARLARLGLDVDEVAFVPVDFVDGDLAVALAGAGQSADRATLFTCEGVAGYLDLEVTGRLLAALRERAAPGSRLAITVPLEPDSADGRAARRRLETAVSGVGEPLRSAVPRADLESFLRRSGWAVARAVDPAGTPVAQSTRTSALVVAMADRRP